MNKIESLDIQITDWVLLRVSQAARMRLVSNQTSCNHFMGYT